MTIIGILIVFYSISNAGNLMAASIATNCQTGFFFDKVTRSCAPCTDVCINAVIQGTVDLCKAVCSGGMTGIKSLLNIEGVPVYPDYLSQIRAPVFKIFVVVFVVSLLVVFITMWSKSKGQTKGQKRQDGNGNDFRVRKMKFPTQDPRNGDVRYIQSVQHDNIYQPC